MIDDAKCFSCPCRCAYPHSKVCSMVTPFHEVIDEKYKGQCRIVSDVSFGSLLNKRLDIFSKLGLALGECVYRERKQC